MHRLQLARDSRPRCRRDLGRSHRQPGVVSDRRERGVRHYGRGHRRHQAVENAAGRRADMGGAVKIGSDQGTSLIETSIATAILLVALVGLMSMITVATKQTENEGHLSARAAE